MTGEAAFDAVAVRLRLDGGRIGAVEIHPRRLAPMQALLKGRSAGEAVAAIPRLFNLCPMAQTIAALDACEKAFGMTPSPLQSAARLLLRLGETLGEHVRHLCLDGPQAFGLAPDTETVKALRGHLKALPDLLGGPPSLDAAWPCPRCDALAEWHRALRKMVLSGLMAGRDVQAMTMPDDLWRWAEGGASAPARLLHAVKTQGLLGFGLSATPLMTKLDLAGMEQRLGGAQAADFAAAPQNDGGLCLETGPLARQYEHALIKTLRREFSGHGLAARLLARLIESSHALAAMAFAFPLLETDREERQPPRDASGVGLGVAEAARGRLFHWLRLENGLVSDWRLLAPTEWNFHPKGAFAQGLLGMTVGDGQTAVRMARWQGLALDPCVALEIEVA